MATINFRGLAPDHTKREVADAVNGVLGGKLNATGSVTLTNSATSTVITDYRVGPDTVILFMPTTSAGATELAAGGMYVSTRAKFTFTITHSSDTTTRSFDYVVIG